MLLWQIIWQFLSVKHKVIIYMYHWFIPTYIPRELKICVHTVCAYEFIVVQPKRGNNPNVHQLMNG